MKFKFCIKNSKEAISTHTANSLFEATSYFAKLKNLSVTKFLEIYTVLEIK